MDQKKSFSFNDIVTTTVVNSVWRGYFAKAIQNNASRQNCSERWNYVAPIDVLRSVLWQLPWEWFCDTSLHFWTLCSDRNKSFDLFILQHGCGFHSISREDERNTKMSLPVVFCLVAPVFSNPKFNFLLSSPNWTQKLNNKDFFCEQMKWLLVCVSSLQLLKFTRWWAQYYEFKRKTPSPSPGVQSFKFSQLISKRTLLLLVLGAKIYAFNKKDVENTFQVYRHSVFSVQQNEFKGKQCCPSRV